MEVVMDMVVVMAAAVLEVAAVTMASMAVRDLCLWVTAGMRRIGGKGG